MNAVRRTVHAALVGGWLGAALVSSAVVAPRAFALFATRAQAGDFVGGVLRVIDGWAVAAGLVAIGLELVRTPSRRAVVLSAALVAAVGVASLLLDAKLGALRRALGPIDALAPDDPGRRHFGMLHGISMLILLIGMLAAAVNLALSSRDEGRETGQSSVSSRSG